MPESRAPSGFMPSPIERSKSETSVPAEEEHELEVAQQVHVSFLPFGPCGHFPLPPMLSHQHSAPTPICCLTHTHWLVACGSLQSSSRGTPPHLEVVENRIKSDEARPQYTPRSYRMAGIDCYGHGRDLPAPSPPKTVYASSISGPLVRVE